MKQEQVIELAKQAGFFYYDMRSEGHGETLEADSIEPALMFAKLVEQATLERAALECAQSEAYRGSVFAARIRAMKDDSNSTEFDGIKTVQMPRFNHAAKRKLEQLLADGAQITGYAFQKADGRHGSIDCHGFVQWRTEQAEVHMPEPVAFLYNDAPTLECYIANERTGIPINSALFSVKRYPNCRNETPLYTEQQLRTLLAQHGIKIAD